MSKLPPTEFVDQAKTMVIALLHGSDHQWAIARDKDHTRLAIRVSYRFEDLKSRDRLTRVYVIRNDEDGCKIEGILASDTVDHTDAFGLSIAMDAKGSRIVVSAHRDSSLQPHAGILYVFARHGLKWKPEIRLHPKEVKPNQMFGYAVSIDGDGHTIVAGSYQTNGIHGGVKNSTYMFTRSGKTWTETAALMSLTADTNLFGCSVEISGNGRVLIIGSPESSDHGNGYVKIYGYVDNVWIALQTIRPSIRCRWFGARVQIDHNGDYAFIDSYGLSNENGVYDVISHRHTYKRTGDQWTETSVVDTLIERMVNTPIKPEVTTATTPPPATPTKLTADGQRKLQQFTERFGSKSPSRDRERVRRY